jgi:hypothetical protein
MPFTPSVAGSDEPGSWLGKVRGPFSEFLETAAVSGPMIVEASVALRKVLRVNSVFFINVLNRFELLQTQRAKQ